MKRNLEKIFIIALMFILLNTFLVVNVKAEDEELSDEEFAAILKEEGYTEEEIAEILAGEYVETDEEEGDGETEEEFEEETEEEFEEETQEVTSTIKENNKDESQSTKKLAYTGLQDYYFLLILVIGFLIYSGIKYKKYKEIQ